VLGRQDIGGRVVVRRIVGVRDNRPLYSDALGELVEVDEAGLTVATRTGPVRIRYGDIQAAKRVPPGVREVTRLEHLANAAWPAPIVETLGDWLLRAADGWTGRANTALPLGNPGMGREAAIDAVTGWYTAHGLPARMNVPLPVCAALDAALNARGWARSLPSLVLTAPLAAVLAAAPPQPDLPPVRLDRTPSAAWLAVVAGRKGELPAAAHHVLTAARSVRCASVEDDLAIARGAVVDGHLHIALLEVAGAARRRGLARHVTRALAEWAAGEGAGTAFLQVESANVAALALYRGLGFTTHHQYVTRTAPAG
jgi:ribosomal protein S18 acetylase RimI-like enzyme